MLHGQHGAEVLAGLMHGVFDPLVESIFEYGGKIVGFAGDGIMALYPVEADAESTALRALTSAYVIQKRFQENPASPNCLWRVLYLRQDWSGERFCFLGDFMFSQL